MKYLRLGDIVDITKGQKVTNVGEQSPAYKHRYIQIGDLRHDENLKYTDESNLVEVNINDLIIAWDGANAGTVGYNLSGIIGSTLARLRIKEPGKINPFFLGYFLDTKFDFLKSKATGATIPHIERNSLENLKVPDLPPESQQQIVAVLDKAQSIIDKRKASLQLLDQLMRDTFLDMFGDPVSNPKKFNTGTIRDLISSVNYGTSGKSEDKGKYPYIRMNNITYEGYFDFTELKYINAGKKDFEKYGLKKNDLVFNRTNSKELVGKTAVYRGDENVLIAGYLIRVRTNAKANPDYISGYLNSAHGKMALKTMCKSIIGMANINAQELQGIKILIPPIELQKKYSKIVDDKFALRKKLTDNLLKSESLFQSLLKKAFSEEGITIKSQELSIQNQITDVKEFTLMVESLPVEELSKKEKEQVVEVKENLRGFLKTEKIFKSQKELTATLEKHGVAAVSNFISGTQDNIFNNVSGGLLSASAAGFTGFIIEEAERKIQKTLEGFQKTIKANNNFTQLLKDLKLSSVAAKLSKIIEKEILDAGMSITEDIEVSGPAAVKKRTFSEQVERVISSKFSIAFFSFNELVAELQSAGLVTKPYHHIDKAEMEEYVKIKEYVFGKLRIAEWVQVYGPDKATISDPAFKPENYSGDGEIFLKVQSNN